MSALQKTIEIVGGRVALAKAINVTPQAIYQWLHGKTQMDPVHARSIELATKGNVTRYDLRPDVFGPPPAVCLRCGCRVLACPSDTQSGGDEEESDETEDKTPEQAA